MFRLVRLAREFDEPAPQVVRFTVLGLGLTESAEPCAAPRTMTRLANHAKEWLRSCFDNTRALQHIRWFVDDFFVLLCVRSEMLV